MTKILGKNYMHAHPSTERALNLDENHCIVDKKDMLEVIAFFEDHPHLIQYLGKRRGSGSIDMPHTGMSRVDNSQCVCGNPVSHEIGCPLRKSEVIHCYW